jgi:hypothetical protein
LQELNNLFFYCETKHNESIVLDVHKLKDLRQWWEKLNLGIWHSKDHRSLIEINNLKMQRYRGFREGLWYNIPDYFWNNFSFDIEKFSYEQQDRSMLFRLSATYKGTDNLDLVSFRVENLEEKD